jgi:hypothetical protein
VSAQLIYAANEKCRLIENSKCETKAISLIFLFYRITLTTTSTDCLLFSVLFPSTSSDVSSEHFPICIGKGNDDAGVLRGGSVDLLKFFQGWARTSIP